MKRCSEWFISPIGRDISNIYSLKGGGKRGIDNFEQILFLQSISCDISISTFSGSLSTNLRSFSAYDSAVLTFLWSKISVKLNLIKISGQTGS